MANLYGVAKRWWGTDSIKNRVEEGGIDNLVIKSKGKPISPKDVAHAVWNADVLIPIMENMKSNHLIKTPDMPTITTQVHILHLISLGRGLDANNLPQMNDELELQIHLVVSSIKKLMCFVRDKFIRRNKPRDPAFGELLAHFGDLELFVDLPNSPETPGEADKEDDEEEEEGLRARLREVPIPSPSTVPVVPEKESNSVGTPKVLENDLISVALPVEDQECIFGLDKKIKAVKAQIAEMKKAQMSKVDAPLVSPTLPVTMVEGNKPPVTPNSTRAEEIKRRIEELKGSIESSSKLHDATQKPCMDYDETQPLPPQVALEAPVAAVEEVEEEVWAPPVGDNIPTENDTTQDSMPQKEEQIPVVKHTDFLQLRGAKKDENSKKKKGKGKGKGKKSSQDDGSTDSKSAPRKVPESRRGKLHRLSSKVKAKAAKETPEDTKPTAPRKAKSKKAEQPAQEGVETCNEVKEKNGKKDKGRKSSKTKEGETSMGKEAEEKTEKRKGKTAKKTDKKKDEEPEDPPALEAKPKESKRKRIEHDVVTTEVKTVVEHLNGQFQGYYKIMVYWSRLAVGFLIFKDGKFKQVCYCTVQKENLMYTVKAMSTIAGMMMNGIDEEPAVANFIYYKSVLTGESSDPTLTAELDALVKQYTEDVICY